jgi:molecular chaperone GrpE
MKDAKKEEKQQKKEIDDNIARVKAEPKKDPKDQKIDELTNDLKRLQAEFENYKKRCEKENASFRDYSNAHIIKKLLTVIDSFEIALKNTGNHEEFVKGVELIYSQFYSILQDEGLKHLETQGKKFDPYLHEVMLSEKSEKEDDTILEELQKGYKLKGCVLRHSKVKVAKK